MFEMLLLRTYYEGSIFKNDSSDFIIITALHASYKAEGFFNIKLKIINQID